MTNNRSELSENHDVIGQRYLLVRQLREEPWGEVWLAQDNLLKTEVGLKLLARDASEWAAARDMFEHEAILGLKLRHPQILGVFHVDKADKFLYLVEEPFAGESLLTQLTRPLRFSMAQALHLLELLAQALACAHQQGEAHRCLSPLNILLQGEDLRLANFAFAPAYGQGPRYLELKAYEAPEVVHGDRPTPAGNVFSLGVLGFRLLAGSLPYPLTFDEPFPYRLEYPPADLEEISVPLQNVLLRCLSEDPEERLPHAGAFVSQLRQARELIPAGDKKSSVLWRLETPQKFRQPLAQVWPWLQNVREQFQPRAQQAKEVALARWNTLQKLPRRLWWWGLGFAILIVAVIMVGADMSRRPAPVSQSVTVAEPVSLPPVGGGPPLVETAEAEPPREPVQASKPAPVQPKATPGAAGQKVTKAERHFLVVATYTNMKQAEVLQQRLRAKNVRAVIITRKTGDKTLYQVRVGPLTSAKAAEDAAGRIKTQENLTPRVVKPASRITGASIVRKPVR